VTAKSLGLADTKNEKFSFKVSYGSNTTQASRKQKHLDIAGKTKPSGKVCKCCPSEFGQDWMWQERRPKCPFITITKHQLAKTANPSSARNVLPHICCETVAWWARSSCLSKLHMIRWSQCIN